MNEAHLAAAAEEGDVERADRGLLLNFNRLIGGLRIRQERGIIKECDTYDMLHAAYDRKCTSREGGSGYELEPELATAKETHKPQREFWLWAHDDLDVILETLRQKERE